MKHYGYRSPTQFNWEGESCTKIHDYLKTFSDPKIETLVELPPELVSSIVKPLLLADIICFSYCNHRSRELLSAQIRQLSLQLSQAERENARFSVLERLERDFPKFFACEICKVLHQYDGSESFGLSGLYDDEITTRLPCVNRKNGWFAQPFSIKMSDISPIPDLSSLQFKLAMRRFLYGSESGISTDSLEYVQVRRFSLETDSSNALSLSSREFRICPNHPSLYVRLQNVLLVSSFKELYASAVESFANDVSFRGHLGGDVFRHMKICGRKCLFGSNHLPRLVRSISTKKGRIDCLSSDEERASETICCSSCGSICQIDIFPFDGKTAIAITRWIDLGCNSTQMERFWEDQKVWIRHKTFTCMPRLHQGHQKHAETDAAYPGLKGDPQRCFEVEAFQSYNSYNDLKFWNLAYLKDEHFRGVMPFRNNYGVQVWYKAYEDHF